MMLASMFGLGKRAVGAPGAGRRRPRPPGLCTRTGSPTPPTASAAATTRGKTRDHARQPAGQLRASIALIATIGLRAVALATIPGPIEGALALIAAHTTARAARWRRRSILMQPARETGSAPTAGRRASPRPWSRVADRRLRRPPHARPGCAASSQLILW